MWSLFQSTRMAYCKMMRLSIWVLQPWPQLQKSQGSWSAFSRQRATVKLILTWLFPWQWHSHWKCYAHAWAMLAHPAVVGNPFISLLVTPEGTWENCWLCPASPADYFHLVELSAANIPPICLQHPSGFHSWGYCGSKLCWSLSISYLILYPILLSSFYRRVTWSKQPPNEQKQDCLYQADFRNSHFCSLRFALQLHFCQKTRIS